MNHAERIRAALRGEAVDRLPINLWMHFSTVDQDPRSLAEAQVAFARKYDFDFIKLMPFGLYGVQDYGAKIRIFNRVNEPPVLDDPGIHDALDWGRIDPLPANYGTYGKQVQLARHTLALTPPALPVIQTIFSPLTTARKLAGDRILLDMKTEPELFHQALQALTDTTINFVLANIEAGVDGFFFATQCANTDFMTEAEYRAYGAAYDLQVLDAYQDVTWFNVAHLHGDNGMFDLIADYPVHALNWHDRWSTPTLAQARQQTDKCLLGGIREVPYLDGKGNLLRASLLESGSVDEVERHVREAVADAGERKLILGPGCVANQLSTEKNLYALRRSVERIYA